MICSCVVEKLSNITKIMGVLHRASWPRDSFRPLGR